jgi:hypothetical protein
LLITVSLLLLSVLFEQFFIAPFFPIVQSAGSIEPMIVFLDIPLSLPVVDWLPVTGLFIIFYMVVVGPSLSRRGQKGLLGKQVWKALTGWYLLFACIAAGGGLYHLAEPLLPKQVANGIDSFGVRADLMIPYPSGELVHLHGGMVQLLFAILGVYLMSRRAAAPQASIAVAEAQAIINTPPPPPQRTPTTTFIKTQRREPAKVSEPARVSEPAMATETATPAPRPSTATAPATPAPKPAPAPRRSSVSVTPPPADRPAPRPTAPAFPGEPPTCRLTTPPPIAIVMPRAAPGVGKAHPCFVIGSLKPKKA